jgi:nicotinamidase-related amidase
MLLDAGKASLLIVDAQEKLLAAMHEPERVIAKTGIVLQASQTLSVPVTVSEHYPKGLGRTVPALQSNAAMVFEKTAFSCWRDGGLKAHFVALHEGGRPQVIVCGVEAHICAMQSCIDLAQAGFAVYAVADAMTSRQPESAALAFDRLRMSNVQVVNAEMVVFELLENAKAGAFKALSQLIK